MCSVQPPSSLAGFSNTHCARPNQRSVAAPFSRWHDFGIGFDNQGLVTGFREEVPEPGTLVPGAQALLERALAELALQVGQRNPDRAYDTALVAERGRRRQVRARGSPRDDRGDRGRRGLRTQVRPNLPVRQPAIGSTAVDAGANMAR